jgi:hypothetical protein
MQMFGQVTIPPTPERIAKGELRRVVVEMFNERDVATMDLRASMLDRYWRDQLLAPEGDLELGRARYDAGLKLAQLYEETGYRQQVVGGYGQKAGVGEISDDADEYLSGKRQAFHGVVRVLQAQSHAVASAVVNLCIHDFDPVDRRELIRGLDVLVRHWGLD